ncbi:asparaginase [Virgibacillus soli]|uniref:Asparaginase n=1 Tax=Paracerasibacillus soli TaxID=480284 RepID=A0ABU5CRS7_9BACI|nr:asparaginase [Virgibacillus soli]MDY0409071.1 asparaginase [Virgibacillus soli]
MISSKQPIQVYRGEYLESTHEIAVAVVNTEGDLLAHYGDPKQQVFARSSMKPFQAVPIVESGALDSFHFSEKELALFCASHIGEPIHRETVQHVLDQLQLTIYDLQCGTHVPRDMKSYDALVRAGKQLNPLYSNCSGKHSGMLVGCKKQGFDIATYREINHPYQQQILEVIAEVADIECKSIGMSVDGCGVPVHRMPLEHVALAYARLAKPEVWLTDNDQRKKSLHRVCQAMTMFPEMVAGTKQFDTDLMQAFNRRVVAKGGAEGVHCFGDKETGIGVAIKVADGNARATTVATMEVLHQLQIGNDVIWDKLAHYHEAPVKNARDETIGTIQAHFSLHIEKGVLHTWGIS